jgi:hypothetical protein
LNFYLFQFGARLAHHNLSTQKSYEINKTKNNTAEQEQQWQPGIFEAVRRRRK